MKNPVDPVSDAQGLLFGLDVNVAGPLVGGFHQDLVHQLDDRGFLGLLSHFAVVGLDSFEQLDVLTAIQHHLRDGVAAHAVISLDEPEDLARAGQDRDHVHPGDGLHLVQRTQVVWVAGGDGEGAVFARQRDQVAAVDQFLRNRGQDVRGHGLHRQIDHVQAELLGQGGENGVFLGEPAFDQHLVRR